MALKWPGVEHSLVYQVFLGQMAPTWPGIELSLVCRVFSRPMASKWPGAQLSSLIKFSLSKWLRSGLFVGLSRVASSFFEASGLEVAWS